MLNLFVHRLAREFCLEHEAATHGGKVVGMLQEGGRFRKREADFETLDTLSPLAASLQVRFRKREADFETLDTLSPLAASLQVRKPEIENRHRWKMEWKTE